MVEEISHDLLPKKISEIHSLPEYFHLFNHPSLRVIIWILSRTLLKIKLVIELKFMEKSAKTVKWVLDKVIFLFPR